MKPRVAPIARARRTEVIGTLTSRTAMPRSAAVFSSIADAGKLTIDEGAIRHEAVLGRARLDAIAVMSELSETAFNLVLEAKLRGEVMTANVDHAATTERQEAPPSLS